MMYLRCAAFACIEQHTAISTGRKNGSAISSSYYGFMPPHPCLASRPHSPHCALPTHACPKHSVAMHTVARIDISIDSIHILHRSWHHHGHHHHHPHHHRRHHFNGMADEDLKVTRAEGSADPNMPQPPPFTAYSKSFGNLEKCLKWWKQKEKSFCVSFFYFSLPLSRLTLQLLQCNSPLSTSHLGIQRTNSRHS